MSIWKRVYTDPQAPAEPCKWFLAAGDFCLPYFIESSISDGTLDNLYSQNLIEALASGDISAVNIECPLTDRLCRMQKSGLAISSPAAAIHAVTKAGFNIALLANNHIMDRGETGLSDTLIACRNNNITPVGAGLDRAQAIQPAFFTIGQTTLAVCAFAEEVDFISAAPNKPGISIFDPASNARIIANARTRADIVIVSVHCGNEYYPLPSPRIQQWCRYLVDAGASAVVCHHQHVIQGMEVYRSTPIIYSLGHFLFNWRAPRPQCWYEGLLCRIGFVDKQIQAVEITGCEQVCSENSCTCRLMDSTRLDRYFELFDRLTEIAAQPAVLASFWDCFCEHKKKTYLANLKCGCDSVTLPALKALVRNCRISHDYTALLRWPADLFSWVLLRNSTRQLNLSRLNNLLTSPAHNDVLANILDMQIHPRRPDPDIQAEFNRLMRYCTI
jgi:hypothetical protein